jgi:flagellin-like hook-associated protein FlgL
MREAEAQRSQSQADLDALQDELANLKLQLEAD